EAPNDGSGPAAARAERRGASAAGERTRGAHRPSPHRGPALPLRASAPGVYHGALPDRRRAPARAAEGADSASGGAAARNPATPMMKPSETPDPGATPLVLVAEDDPTAAAMLKSFLRRVGYEVRHASDGAQAL